MAINRPDELIEKLKNLELEASTAIGAEVANAITYSHLNYRPAYNGVFFYKPEERLLSLVNDNGLAYPDYNEGLDRGDLNFKENIYETNDISWSHFISAFGAQLTCLRNKKTSYLDIIIEPALKAMNADIKKMMGSIDASYKRAFLFTLGGDMLQDKIFGYESPWDYRGDIIGMERLQKNGALSKPLSVLVEEGFKMAQLVEGEKYKDHSYFKSSMENSDLRGIQTLRKTGILGLFYDLVVSGTKIKRKTRKFA